MKEGQPIPRETPVMDREVFNAAWAKEKVERHVDNLAHFTGFWHGTFYFDGVVRKGSNGLGHTNGKNRHDIEAVY